jgi:hypothetical protein
MDSGYSDRYQHQNSQHQVAGYGQLKVLFVCFDEQWIIHSHDTHSDIYFLKSPGFLL